MQLIDGNKTALEIQAEISVKVSALKANGKKTPHLPPTTKIGSGPQASKVFFLDPPRGLQSLANVVVVPLAKDKPAFNLA